MELLTLGVGLLLGCIVGFNFGVRKVADACHESAHIFIDALRDRYGAERLVLVGGPTDVPVDPTIDEAVEVRLLDSDIEALASPLFHLR